MRIGSAPAKIILAGEYAVVYGYPGIAVPAPCGVTARYEEDFGKPDLQVVWHVAPENRCYRGEYTLCVDPRWKKYLERIVERCKQVDEQPFGTLTIETDVPLGKGMGSSTALVIAITRALLGEDCESIARGIEDAMNPGHSGIDFATCWHNAPIEFRKGEEPKILRLERNLLEHFELIDTGMPDQTTPELVAWMDGQVQNDEHAHMIEEALRTIGRCAERIIAGEDVKAVIRDHHHAQVKLGVVPTAAQQLIKKIEQEGGAGKVIGAGGRTGGGGMVLAWKNL